MRYLRAALRLLPGLLLAVTLLGCDSGGDNGGGGLGDSATLEVEGPSDVTVNWSAEFFFDQADGFCVVAGTGNAGSGQPPFEATLDPGADSFSDCPPEGTAPEDFMGVRATASTRAESVDLTVRLLSDGNEIDVAEEPEEEGNLEGFWVVTGGEVPSLSDFQ